MALFLFYINMRYWICHCERSEAIHAVEKVEKLDCFVTLFLAMTPSIIEVLIEKWNEMVLCPPPDVFGIACSRNRGDFDITDLIIPVIPLWC